MENQIVTTNKGLTIEQKDVISKMPFSLQKYVKAKDSPKISDLGISDALKFLVDLIASTQVNIGHVKRAEDEEANLQMAENLLNLIKSKFQSLTVDELKLAVLNGSISEYGDYATLSFKTISDWIKSYLNDVNKKHAMAEWNRCLDNVKKHEYTEEQKEQIEIDGLLHYFKEFKENKMMEKFVMPVDYLCAIFYLRLKTNGVITENTFSKEKKIEMYDKAKFEYENGFKDKNISKDIYGSMIQMIAKKQNRPFDHLCKRIALHEYFNSLIKRDVELIDELNKSKK